MDIWAWISDLPNTTDWSELHSPPIFYLTPTNKGTKLTSKSILLKAERSSDSINNDTIFTLSICINGFHPSNPYKTLWVSDPCPLSSDQPFLPLLLQLVHEIITRSPTMHNTINCSAAQFPKPKPEPVSWILNSHSPESFSTFFNFIFLCRLFWLCVSDVPASVGAVYFKSILDPNLDLVTCKHVLRVFLMAVGVDAELCVMRTLGYMSVKWLMVRDLGVGLSQLLGSASFDRFSYAMEAHGFWVLKGYNPVLSMTQTHCNSSGKRFEANDTVLKYALAHQQLEAVIQLEYSVTLLEGFIQVKARVDNLRFHVVKLGFNKNENEEGEYVEERYFPSRIRVWVGPEIGSTYVSMLSLGRSTINPETETETQKIFKGKFGKSKVDTVKAKARMTTKTKTKTWRWDQDVEANTGIFEGVLYDNVSGMEMATLGMKGGKNGFEKRYSSVNRAFNKTGGLVVVGEECGEGVVWRLDKEMEGSVLKWRLGGKVWLSYCPSEIKSSSYFETRCVEWCEEVDLPLLVTK